MATIDFIQLNKTNGTGNDTVQLSTDKNSSFSSKIEILLLKLILIYKKLLM